MIAGTYRSRTLQAPRGLLTRPTSDRLRETLFNVLQPRLEDSSFVDLYAGSGAVGIEALSRGAREVFFAETDKAALTAIRANLSSLGIRAGTQVESAGTATLLKRLAAAEARVDIVFLDPPYQDAAEYTATLQTVAAQATRLLLPGAVVVAEHARKLSLADTYGLLHRYRQLTQGDAVLSFYAVAEESAAQP